MEWYAAVSEQILKKLNTPETGLSPSEATSRLESYGYNTLAQAESIILFKLILHQFTSPLILILLIAAGVTFLLKEYIDSAVIIAVVILNAVIGFTQEVKAEKSVQSLKKLLVAKARVLRDGHEVEIPSSALVPGDLVLLTSGARVPADLRLLYTLELKVDESMLTGESVPVEKTYQALSGGKKVIGDQANMAFMGTSIVNGRARGIVVSTGKNTILGGIAEEVQEIGLVKAPIQEKIESIAKVIGLLVLGASMALFMIGLLAGQPLKTMFMVTVAAAVAAIPEGLPIVVTIAMAVGVTRMARHSAIVRKLPAVETLGSTTVICSDKTGTLTRNEMTVTRLYDGYDTYTVDGIGYDPTGNIYSKNNNQDEFAQDRLLRLLEIGLHCNESQVYQENNFYKIDGDPTEGALIVSASKGGLYAEYEKEHSEQLAIIPFESERGFMATLHQLKEGRYILLKGAPERVLGMCLDTDNLIEKATDKAIEFATDGMRVLGFAWKRVSESQEDLTHADIVSGFTFAGLQAMIDPPRTEVIKAIADCKDAGIRVVMITGDHKVTAQAIGTQLGIIQMGEPVLTGKDIDEMDDDLLFQQTKTVSIFARVAPEHKVRITRQLIKHGHIVAMTGDGVNDAPALKAAHIGIAMGITGTDVAKEASDMVLADDNFSSIFHAVKEGRIVFDNLRKVIFFLLPTGLASIVSIIITLVMGVPIPYLAAQLLWINLVTNGLQDVALAFEPGEKDILKRPPRPPEEGILSSLLLQRTVLVGLVIAIGIVYNYISALQAGKSLEHARTVAVTTMVFFQFFQAWNSRSEFRSLLHIPLLSNPFLFYSLIFALIAQIAFTYLPALQWIFRTVPITGADWLRCILVASSVIITVESDKWFRARYSKTAN